MSFIEFIGFIIAVVVMMILSARKAREERRRRSHPEEYEKEQAQQEWEYRELLKTLDLPIPEELHPTHKKHKHKQPLDPKADSKSQHSKRPKPAQSSDGWKAPVTKRIVRSDFKFQSRIDARHQKTQIDDRRLKNAIEGRAARFKKAVGSEGMYAETSALDAYSLDQAFEMPRSTLIFDQLRDPIQMVLFHEIMAKPRALEKMGPLKGLPWEG